MSLIVLMAVLIGLEASFPSYTSLKSMQNFIIWIFALEVVVKFVSEGRACQLYFYNAWNTFDFIVTFVAIISLFGLSTISLTFHYLSHFPLSLSLLLFLNSVSELSLTHSLSLLPLSLSLFLYPFSYNKPLELGSFNVSIFRLFRLMQLMRSLSKVVTLRIIVECLTRAIRPMRYIAIIFTVFNYLFAVLGVVLFQRNDPFHFGSLQKALLTIYRFNQTFTFIHTHRISLARISLQC